MFDRQSLHQITPNVGTWLQHEFNTKFAILKAFWDRRIVKYNKNSVDQFKCRIMTSIYPVTEQWEQSIQKLFSDAISNTISFQDFYDAIKFCPLSDFTGLNDVEGLLNINNGQHSSELPVISDEDITALQTYLVQKRISASMTFGNVDKLITPEFPENHQSQCFAMHSISKVFTGMLALLMVRKGIISEQSLKEVIQLDDVVLQTLPPNVKEQLSKVTLHQLMTHCAGLGDYFCSYVKAIEGKDIPKIHDINDFLPFVDNQLFPIGEVRYSNVGILMLGLALQHAYVKEFDTCNYYQILQQFIIQPANLKSFSMHMPINGAYHPSDQVAPHIAGSPAGGYWISSEDLAKFGQWVYQQCVIDEELMRLMKQYGQEFYDENELKLAHSGGIQSSSAYLSVSFKSGAVLAVLSDQPRMAFDLKVMISEKMLDIPAQEWKWGDSQNPSKYIIDKIAQEKPARVLFALPVRNL